MSSTPPVTYDDRMPPPEDGYLPLADPFLPDAPPSHQAGPQGFEPPDPLDEDWSWHDARLIGVERETDDGTRYEIGCIDLYASAHSGDLGGSYLPVASFGDVDVAAAFYHDLQGQMHQQGLPAYQVPDFAEARAAALNPEPANWRGAAPAEYAAYEHLRDLEAFDPALADDPPQEALDPLIQTAIELGGVVVEPEMAQGTDDPSAFKALQASADALAAIGIQAENFDPTHDPPPFYDPETGTAYWIGVFQPDKDDRDNCVTSILSLGRNAETGAMEAQLAPCVPGDWDKAYASAEYLIQVAQKGGIEQVFDTAEGMALATDQRDFWQSQRGLPLEPEATREIAERARDTWEMEL